MNTPIDLGNAVRVRQERVNAFKAALSQREKYGAFDDFPLARSKLATHP